MAFSQERYYELLNTNPIEAQNYLDSARFGVSDPVGEFNRIAERQEQGVTEQNAALQTRLAEEFKAAHPQFPANGEAAATMVERIDVLMKSGKPLSLETMNAAYRELLREGELISEAQAQRMSMQDLEQVVRDSGAEI